MLIKVGQSPTYNSTASVATQAQVPGLLIAPGANASSAIVPFSRNNAPAPNAANASYGDGSDDDNKQNVSSQVNVGTSTNSAPAKNVVISFAANPQVVTGFANPAIATPLGLGAAALLVAAPAQVGKIFKARSSNIQYSEKAADKLLDTSMFSDKELAAIYDKAVGYILNPSSIKFSKQLASMYNNRGQRDAGEFEYRKLVLRVCSIIVSGHLPIFTFDGDGNILFKDASFVSAIAPTEANQDRVNIGSSVLFLKRFRSFINSYRSANPGSSIEDPSQIALFALLSMRATGWDGISVRGVQRTPHWSRNGEGSEVVRTYKKDAIDSMLMEFGIGPDYKNPLVGGLSFLGLGGVVGVENGGEINFFKGSQKNIQFVRDTAETWDKMNALTSSDREVQEHIKRLKALSDDEFIDAYMSYLPGGKNENVHLGGLLNELALVTERTGIGILEVKMVPHYTLDTEWDKHNLRPRYDDDLKIANWLEEAFYKRERGESWKQFLLEKFRPISNTSHNKNKVPITTELWNKLVQSNDLESIIKTFRKGAVLYSVSHAMDGMNAMVASHRKEYDFYKRVLLEKLYQKYGDHPSIKAFWSSRGYDKFITTDSKENAVFGVTDNGPMAPYQERGTLSDKADVNRTYPWSIQVGGGDSISSDLGMIITAIDNAYAKRGEVETRFREIKQYFLSKGLWKYSSTEEAKLLEHLRTQGVMLGKKTRGQIDLLKDRALQHMIKSSLREELDTPFKLKKVGEKTYQLLGTEYKSQKGKRVSETELKEILRKIAKPWYEDKISSAPDVHQTNQQMSDLWFSLMGFDPDKLDHDVLAKRMLGDTEKYRLGSSLLMLYPECDGKISKTLGIKSPKNVNDLATSFIRRSPEIGSAIGLVGAALAGIGVAGEIYDNVSHNNKYDAAFRDMVAKAFSVSNLGLALSTVFIKGIYWPFQLIGSLLGISSGFLPSGRVQQYVALGSMISWLFGSAREIGHDHCSFIDPFPEADKKEIAKEFTVVNPFVKSSVDGKGTNLDLKGILVYRNKEARDLLQRLIPRSGPEWFKNLVKYTFAKPVSDLSWNFNALKDVFRDSKLIQPKKLINATNGFAYHSPYSLSHFLNVGGWTALGLLAATCGLQLADRVMNSDPQSGDSNDPNLSNINLAKTQAPSSRMLLDPRVTSVNKIAYKDDTLDKLSSTLGAVSSLVPAVVFLTQGYLRSRNATGNRLLWARETGAQVRYRPAFLGNGLMVASGAQAASALSLVALSSGLLGAGGGLSHAFQNVYNLGAALALALQSIGTRDGDSIKYVRDRLSIMDGTRSNSYMGDPLQSFKELAHGGKGLNTQNPANNIVSSPNSRKAKVA